MTERAAGGAGTLYVVDAGARPAVTVLAGFSPAATHAVARCLLAGDESLLLVRHDLAGIRDGVVHRVVRTASGAIEDERIALVHGCVSCTLREDVLPTLVRLARAYPGRDIVLVLPEVVEPMAVAAACAHCLVDGALVTDIVRFDSYVTVVDASRALDDLTSTDDLAHRGMHAADDDHRAVAEVVCRQIEYPDTVLLWGEAPCGEFDTTRLSVLLHRLAPWAVHLAAGPSDVEAVSLAGALRNTDRHDQHAPDPVARLEGRPVGVHEPTPDCGVVSALFHARRPFHPQRLHDALEDLTGEAIRSRGHLWLASQPDTVLAWESAGGGLSMGSLGPWLAALPEAGRAEASDLRRLAADLDWDPYYGDRHTRLAFIGGGFDAADLHRLLASCLLTDAELADGEQAWAAFADPFADCFATAEAATEADPPCFPTIEGNGSREA